MKPGNESKDGSASSGGDAPVADSESCLAKRVLIRILRVLRWLVLALIALVLLGLGVRAVFFRGPYRAPEPLPAVPFLDVHCHIAGIGAGGSGCFISERLRRSFKFDYYLRAFGVTRAELESKDDALLADRLAARLRESRHVNRAVVLALDGVVDEHGELDRARTEFYVPDVFVADACARHANLLFGASINPYRKDALARLDWAHAHGARLVKWLPSIQFIDPADERIAPFYRRLAELKLPLLVHVGQERSFTQARDEFADPLRLRLPLRLGVTVIAAHVASTGEYAGERAIDRLARLMGEHPNLYSEISSLTQLNKLGYLDEALNRPEFQGRLLYGTDFPLINTPLVSAWFYPLNLRLAQMREIARIPNPWDRDVALKQALGVPTALWTRADAVIR